MVSLTDISEVIEDFKRQTGGKSVTRLTMSKDDYEELYKKCEEFHPEYMRQVGSSIYMQKLYGVNIFTSNDLKKGEVDVRYWIGQ